jgi:hypothetical protein
MSILEHVNAMMVILDVNIRTCVCCDGILAVRKKNAALHPNFQWFVPKEAAYLK